MFNQKLKNMHKIVIHYDDIDGGGTSEYSGEDLIKMLKEIIHKHSYSIWDEDDEEFKEKTGHYHNVESLFEYIRKNNGDGCDWILAIWIDGKLSFAFATIQYFKVK
jgi:hypothetical protein